MKYKITFEFETDELIDKDTFLSEYQCDLEKMLKYWGETPTSFLDGCLPRVVCMSSGIA